MESIKRPGCIMDTGIYSISCLPTGKRYVGSALSFKKRWREHRRQLEAGIHHSRFLQRAWSKYGSEFFAFRVILVCSRTNLIAYEQALIDGLRPEYNSAPTAGSQLGYRHTDEARAKMSLSRPKDFSPMAGKSHTDEARRRISEGRAGKGGGPRPPEWIDSLRAAQKGRIKSAEHRAKISAALSGHKQSLEQIEKRMKHIRGRVMPEGFAEAQSARRLGMKFTADHCTNIGRSKAKLSDAQVREIKALLEAGFKQKLIAGKFGVDPSVISTIKTRTAYAWVE